MGRGAFLAGFRRGFRRFGRSASRLRVRRTGRVKSPQSAVNLGFARVVNCELSAAGGAAWEVLVRGGRFDRRLVRTGSDAVDFLCS